MAEYKFKIGETVNFYPKPPNDAPRGAYQIIRRLPAAEGEFQYVIKLSVNAKRAKADKNRDPDQWRSATAQRAATVVRVLPHRALIRRDGAACVRSEGHWVRFRAGHSGVVPETTATPAPGPIVPDVRVAAGLLGLAVSYRWEASPQCQLTVSDKTFLPAIRGSAGYPAKLHLKGRAQKQLQARHLKVCTCFSPLASLFFCN
jgi:hypothetical protein